MEERPVKIARRQLRLLLLLGAVVGCWGIPEGSSGYSFGETGGKNGNCPGCHSAPGKISDKRFIDPVIYAQTTHARIGCPSCHDSIAGNHQAQKGSSAKADCTRCHGDILSEYAASSHGGMAPCSGCHDPHRARTTVNVSGAEINRMCSGCHDRYRMIAVHSEWLPQADLHVDMLPCVTCHTGSRDYVITMYIVNRKGGERFGKLELAPYDELKKHAGERDILSLVDSNGDGYISLAELRLFNSAHQSDPLRLKAMMTPERVTHSFQILDNRRNCTFCHASGPGAMQTSYLAVPQSDGTLQRIAVEKGAVIDALYATPDFYMTGATRNATLNKIGGMIIAGGLIMPVGHGFLRFLTRKNRKEKENGHE